MGLVSSESVVENPDRLFYYGTRFHDKIENFISMAGVGFFGLIPLQVVGFGCFNEEVSEKTGRTEQKR
jgi:hypothetical protein